MLQVQEIYILGEREIKLAGPQHRGMLFVISGSGRLGAGEQMEICRGRVLFLSGEEIIALEEDTVLTGFLVGFEELYFEDFILHYPRFKGSGAFEGLRYLDVCSADVLVLIEELRWLKAEIQSGLEPMRIKLRFNLVMLLVLGGMELDMGNDGRVEQLRSGFLALLEANFPKQRTSGFYASKLGLTTRKLNELCRTWFEGKGFVVLHQERLVLEAEHLLLETDKPVKEIAFELGFCSQQHFRAYIVKLKCMCPTMFRKK